MALHVLAYSWNRDSHLGGTEILDETDQACLEELRDVLTRYDRTSKFGVTLLHKHFDLENDELLVEANDPVGRTLTVTVERPTEEERSDLLPTMWRFDGGPGYACRYCNKNHCT